MSISGSGVFLKCIIIQLKSLSRISPELEQNEGILGRDGCGEERQLPTTRVDSIMSHRVLLICLQAQNLHYSAEHTEPHIVWVFVFFLVLGGVRRPSLFPSSGPCKLRARVQRAPLMVLFVQCFVLFSCNLKIVSLRLGYCLTDWQCNVCL